jgi:hypothetical protein
MKTMETIVEKCSSLEMADLNESGIFLQQCNIFGKQLPDTQLDHNFELFSRRKKPNVNDCREPLRELASIRAKFELISARKVDYEGAMPAGRSSPSIVTVALPPEPACAPFVSTTT